MSDVIFTDNSPEVLADLEQAVARSLETIGGIAESYAKGLVAPRGPKGNPMNSDVTMQVRNSINHQVEGNTVKIGSNLDKAAYVELGTSKEYDPPPEWIDNEVKKGPNSGLDKWFFYDEKEGRVRIGLPMKGTPFLRPAVINHVEEYKQVVENELRNA